MSSPTESTPLESLKPQLLEQLDQRPVVLSAPTGTGKSTLVPRWLSGRVLVIEPRRVACRALAERVAKLEGVTLGREVGYRVKHDDSSGSDTRILFATPGIVLADVNCLQQFDLVVLDEFHERRLDTDWLLAYLLHLGRRFLVMSATIAGDAIAQHVGGAHLAATARAFPVETQYLGAAGDLPSDERLAHRVMQAASRARSDGDILVFLPGKAEIRECSLTSSQSSLGQAFEPFELHGGLTLKEQSRVFTQSSRRKLIFSTNVAETSLTIPNVKTVIDSGLVRRTAYHGGRGYLTLTAIATDSAEQRKGRAGRTGPGECFRLWGKGVQLEPVTPPEIHRESLVPFVLWSAANQVSPEQLPCLDAPKPHALETAQAELRKLQALDEQGRITTRGRSLHRIPLDPWYGRLLVEAQGTDLMHVAIDLVAALSQTPALMLPPVDDPESVQACDAVALVELLRASPARADHWSLKEARQTSKRLRQWFGLAASVENSFDRTELLELILRADPRSAHVARVRKRHTHFSAGGTELELARDSRAGLAKTLEAIIVLSTRASMSGRKKHLIATRASAAKFSLLNRMGLGTQRVGSVSYKSGELTVSTERVYAGKVIGTEQVTPSGDLLRKAVAQLYLRGSWFPNALKQTQQRLQRRALLFGLKQTPVLPGAHAPPSLPCADSAPPPNVEDWIHQRLSELGLNQADELTLLSEPDLICEDVGAEVLPTLETEYPLQIDLGDCVYDVQYDLPKRQVILSIIRGKRSAPPPRNYLPRFPGFRVFAEAGGGLHALKPRA